jgi:hypothetical protein
VEVPVSAVTGFTTTLAAAPTPPVVLQETAGVLAVCSKFEACMVPMEAVKANNTQKTLARWHPGARFRIDGHPKFEISSGV